MNSEEKRGRDGSNFWKGYKMIMFTYNTISEGFILLKFQNRIVFTISSKRGPWSYIRNPMESDSFKTSIVSYHWRILHIPIAFWDLEENKWSRKSPLLLGHAAWPMYDDDAFNDHLIADIRTSTFTHTTDVYQTAIQFCSIWLILFVMFVEFHSDSHWKLLN